MSKFFTGLVLLCLSLSQYCTAQMHPLKVGDRLPHIPGFGRPAKKLLLLDFWGTGCKSCIEAFPVMEKLQQEFPGDLQIILVNDETVDSTERFFKRRKFRRPDLPIVSGNPSFKLLFPRNYVPWHVWIDSTGTIQYITNGYNATAENVAEFLAGKDVALTQIKYGEPEQTELEENYVFYSKLLHHIPGFVMGHRNSPVGDDKFRFSTSGNRVELLKNVFKEKERYDFQAKNTVQLKVADPGIYYPPVSNQKIDSWLAQNGFSYDLVIPETWKDQLYIIAQQEVCKALGVRAFVEKQRVSCYMLIDLDTCSPSTVMENGFNTVTGDAKIVLYHPKSKKQLAEKIGYLFANQNCAEPVLDGTKFSRLDGAQIPLQLISPQQLPELRQYLKIFGVDLVKTEAFTDVLVICEPGYELKKGQ